MAVSHHLVAQSLTEPERSIYNKVWVEDIISEYGYPQELIWSYNIGEYWTTLTRIQLAEIIVRKLYDEHPETSSTYWVALQYLYKHMPASMLLTAEKLSQVEDYTARGYYRVGLYNDDFTLYKVLFGDSYD